MASKPRIIFEGHAYHVNIKAVAGVKAFPDSVHRERFLALLAVEIAKSNWTCLGYAILGTHYHVAVRIREKTLSSGFQRLNSAYAKWFNREHGRTGALWQSRFYEVPIETDYQLLELQRYLARNASRANLVTEPEAWAYCHYGALIGLYPADELVAEHEILGLIDPDPRRARLRLRQFVEEADARRRRALFL